MSAKEKYRITLFHCINTVMDGDVAPAVPGDDLELKTVKMACSSMVKDVFLLRAFEAGSDAVVVMVCPEGQCRYVEGNARARKRVAWVQGLLDEIGLGAARLAVHPVAAGDTAAAEKIIGKVLTGLAAMGPSPAR